MEQIIIDVGIYNAHPGERVEVKISFLDVAVESSPLVRPHFQLDSDPAELLLQRLCDPLSQVQISRFVREFEAGERAVSVGIGEAGFIQQSLGLFRIVAEPRHGGLVGPVLRREQAGCGNRQPFQDMADNCLAIYRMADRVADLTTFQNRMIEIHADILKNRSLLAQYRGVGVFL